MSRINKLFLRKKIIVKEPKTKFEFVHNIIFQSIITYFIKFLILIISSFDVKNLNIVLRDAN